MTEPDDQEQAPPLSYAPTGRGYEEPEAPGLLKALVRLHVIGNAIAFCFIAVGSMMTPHTTNLLARGPGLVVIRTGGGFAAILLMIGLILLLSVSAGRSRRLTVTLVCSTFGSLLLALGGFPPG